MRALFGFHGKDCSLFAGKDKENCGSEDAGPLRKERRECHGPRPALVGYDPLCYGCKRHGSLLWNFP